jgi:hypothetical protein
MASKKEPLSITHPDLAAQANGWDPSSIVSGSGKRVSWKCSRGHEWQAIVMNRTRGTGCPICSGRVADQGVNDIATTNPILAAQADGWDPKTLSAFSSQKVGWVCNQNHRWMAKVADRSNGNGCPFCSGHRVLVGFNDLATINPALAAQADGWDPTTVVANSNKKMHWKCDLGHKWDAWIGNRSKGSGCPICSGHQILVGFNDLATTNPILAAQADGWDPKTLSAFSSQKVGWVCNQNHRWMAKVADRSNGNGCPFCSGHRVLVGFNDLATINPALAAQADGWDPTTVVEKSGKSLKWVCESGHRWKATVGNRSSGRGCPVCANRTVLVGFNDLATTNPTLAAQADGWDPTTVVIYSNRKVPWICEFNHRWSTSIASRSGGAGCPYCSGRFVIPGVSDLATTHPGIAEQADGWDPTTLSAFSNKKVQWICSFDHKWQAIVGSRARGNGCPVCSGQKVLPGYNDLATVNPELAAQADGWDPTSVTSQTHIRVGWVCVLGHKWTATVKNRFRSRGCPVCSHKQLLVGFNDLATTNPELAAQADGWDPSTVFANTDKIMNWKCSENHTWKASPNNRSQGKNCPSCAKFGFNPGNDGWLYFIENEVLEMYQIGISNVPENRLKKHSLSGWNIIEVRGPMNGFLTQDLEKSSLNALKRRGAILGRKDSLVKFDGHTEAWTRASLPVTSIKQILDWVYEDESE